MDATIYCKRESHKGIIIGKEGRMLKRISSSARYDLEKELEKIDSIQKQPESFLKNKRKLQEELDNIASVIPAK